MTSISVVIVNHNTCDLVRSCLHSIQADQPDEVIIVDNASTDGSVEMIYADFRWVRLIRNERNMGYGAAANRAVAQCQTPYFLLLNADTILRPGVLKKFSDYLDQHPHAAMVGPRLLDPDGTLQSSCFPFPTPLDIFLDVSHVSHLMRFIPILRDRYMRSWNHLHSRQVPWVVGAALAIRREAFQACGGFDETFFMYYEEVDLCYRLWQRGWQIHYLPSAEIVHIGGAATEKYRVSMVVQLYTSLANFYRHHYSKWRLTQLTLLVEWIAFARLIRDSAMHLLARDTDQRSRLAGNTAAWKRLLFGAWRG